MVANGQPTADSGAAASTLWPDDTGAGISRTPPALPPRPLADSDALLAALRDLGEFCDINPDITEEEVKTYAVQGVFAALGYRRPGEDTFMERQDADIVLRTMTGRTLAVVEFKRPNVSPSDGLQQLEQRYIGRLLPDIGVVCNGHDLWIYRCSSTALHRPAAVRLHLIDATLSDAQTIYQWLGRREIDFANPDEFKVALSNARASAIPVQGPGEVGGQAFLDRFALRGGTVFGRLVGSMVQALPVMLASSKFTQGAFAFWRRIYAHELDPDNVPAAWRGFLSEQTDLYHLMFALESAYAVLSRLLLARTMENHDFPGLDMSDVLGSGLARHRGPSRRVPMGAHASALQDAFTYAGNYAFEAIFASDIFDWWHDIGRYPTTSPVGERLAEAILSMVEFDFAPMSGDLLGDLYQSYFDPETRKALGEFYTPPAIVDFILDKVGYIVADNPTLPLKRLADPACGSGTFVVHALQRYLGATRGQPAEQVLRRLLGGLKVVGFDVNPFAVLMARANYAAQIIPLFAQALHDNATLPPLTIPIFRTDSLRQEYREGEKAVARPDRPVQPALFSATPHVDVTLISTELPVQVGPDQFFRTDIPVPRYDKAHDNGWVGNPEEYFAALRVLFQSVADAVAAGWETVDIDSLGDKLDRAELRYAQQLAGYMAPAATQLVSEMKKLREQYDDGRFLQTLADLALALILKNDVQYDYIVGNPPYIRSENIPVILRAQWQQWYQWARGKFDAYIPFIERSVAMRPVAATSTIREWLTVGGKLGFIVPNRFLSKDYAGRLRERLPREAAVELLYDFLDSRVFKDALNYPAILVARRLAKGESGPDAIPVVRVFDDPRQGPQALLTEADTLLSRLHDGKAYARGSFSDAFAEPTHRLGAAPWLLMTEEERRVFTKIEAAARIERAASCPICGNTPTKRKHPHLVRLEDVTLTSTGAFQGIATGDDDSLIVRVLEDRGQTLVVRPHGADRKAWKGPDRIEIERGAVRPWLYGVDVNRWSIAWGGWYVLFPYASITAWETRDGNTQTVTRFRLIPSRAAATVFEKVHKYVAPYPLIDDAYPLAWEYLNTPAIAARLRKRDRGVFQPGKRGEHLWYGASRPQSLECYSDPKILIQMLSRSSKAALDGEPRYVFQAGGGGGGLYGILPNTALIGHDVLTGLINTRVFDYYLKQSSIVYGNKYYSYSDGYINSSFRSQHGSKGTPLVECGC